MAAPLVKVVATPGGRRALRWAIGAAVGLVLLPALLVVALFGPAASSSGACGDQSGDADPVGGTVGALGGVSGTGITRADVVIVRGGRAQSVTAGQYMTTAYGPPWGGIQGAGISTAAGLRINGGAPHMYFVAVDPSVISLGSWVYLRPKPLGWDRPFLAAETGGAIKGRRIDFYDWRGRTQQNGWGRRMVEASARPFVAPGKLPEAQDGPLLSTEPTSPTEDPAACGGAVDVGGSGAGRRAVQIAVAQLGKNARTQSFKGFKPSSFLDAWCSWFVSNAWRLAGVKIGTVPYSGNVYTWAATSHPKLILKRQAERARTLKLPVGTALMYGASSTSSDHINMVRSVNPDGSVQIIGGNQDGSRVTTYGPCRLTNGTYVHLSGPGCDTRDIFGIVAPSLDSNADTPSSRED